MVATFKSSSGNFDGSNPLILPVGVAVSVSDQIILAVGTTATSTPPTSVGDQQGNVGVRVSYQVGIGDTHSFSVWLIPIAHAGVPVITATTNGATSPAGVVGAALIGLGAVELSTPLNSSGGGFTWTSRDISPSSANAIVFDFDWSYSEPTSIADDFVSDQSVVVAASQLDLAHLVVGSLGTYNSSWSSVGEAGWRNVIVGVPLTRPPAARVPLPFSQRTTAAVAVFPCIAIASPQGAQMLAFGDVSTTAALQSEYSQLLYLYRMLCNQNTSNRRSELIAEVNKAIPIVAALYVTLQSMSATGDAGVQLAHMQRVVEGAVNQIGDVQFDEEAES